MLWRVPGLVLVTELWLLPWCPDALIPWCWCICFWSPATQKKRGICCSPVLYRHLVPQETAALRSLYRQKTRWNKRSMQLRAMSLALMIVKQCLLWSWSHTTINESFLKINSTYVQGRVEIHEEWYSLTGIQCHKSVYSNALLVRARLLLISLHFKMTIWVLMLLAYWHIKAEYSA